MEDRAIALLDHYEIEVTGTKKGRGAILCDTDKGSLIFKEYTGNVGRLKKQQVILNEIQSSSEKSCKIQVEQILPNKEGELYVEDHDGVKYILKTYCEGREFRVRDREDCLRAVKILSDLHERMQMPRLEEEHIFSPAKEYEKRNKELKKVKKYLLQKGQKSVFERALLQEYDFFLEQAIAMTEEWKKYEERFDREIVTSEKVVWCHGDYQYHNVLLNENTCFIINFEHFIVDDQIRDLHLLMRKLLEKNNWSFSLGRDLLEAYSKKRKLSAISYIDLYYRLAYPEKFWKIVNFYYNVRKSWIPEKNREKLLKLVEQEKDKQAFLNQVFREGTERRTKQKDQDMDLGIELQVRPETGSEMGSKRHVFCLFWR